MLAPAIEPRHTDPTSPSRSAVQQTAPRPIDRPDWGRSEKRTLSPLRSPRLRVKLDRFRSRRGSLAETDGVGAPQWSEPQ